MGCRAISPKMVGLARRLEGMPFHLIATDRQRGDRDERTTYMKSLGISADSPNFTLTSGGGHPGVRGNGYVPYYMVFDHRGKLAREHMCGAYHGGDGDGFIEWVDRLLLEAPAIYLGEEPFAEVPALAAKIAKRKALGATLRTIEKRLAGEPEAVEKAELERLLAVVEEWRDRRLGNADALLATRPSGVLERLDGLAKELRGSSLAKVVEVRAKELKSSRDLKDAIAIEKTLRKTRAALEKVEGARRTRAVAAARKKLEKAIDGKDGLPISATVRDFLSGLE